MTCKELKAILATFDEKMQVNILVKDCIRPIESVKEKKPNILHDEDEAPNYIEITIK